MPALLEKIKDDIEVDDVKGKAISIYIFPDDAQPVDLIIGRTWLDLPHIAYTKIIKGFHIGNREDEPFRNFPIDERINQVCLKALEIAQLEKESLQIKRMNHDFYKEILRTLRKSDTRCFVKSKKRISMLKTCRAAEIFIKNGCILYIR
ncbi:hypothetical protein AVEN_33848-1 [Araneus ventricosus]|uniref:Uncharacterized protein n=1 Tax=Araneus ventricosus TaxID=182803 RepID=A0A4Y2J3W2_ARAVE|nr:hypothetical protein AVEN_33848-1 [Araneus ventricosus]